MTGKPSPDEYEWQVGIRHTLFLLILEKASCRLNTTWHHEKSVVVMVSAWFLSRSCP